MVEEKRQGGQTIEVEGKKKWLVLTESTGKEEEGYRHKCGTDVLGAKVAHPIWDGPFACSGSGSCHYESVPFCPECETKPGFHGAPIDVPFPGIAHKV